MIPSLSYLSDVISPALTVKCVGSQWFWSYEVSDFIAADGSPLTFDSYMVPDTDLEDGSLRLLEVDNRLVLPVDVHTRFIVTGQDVIHDFACPSLGLKIDCTPGRLNETSVVVERAGVYYGQCSELDHLIAVHDLTLLVRSITYSYQWEATPYGISPLV